MRAVRAGKRLLAVIAMVLAAPFAAPAQSLAWMCGMPTPEEAFDNTPYIFRGVPVEMREVKQGGMTKVLATFRVRDVWKGDVDPIQEVRIHWLFDVPFRLHKDYLVYATRETYSGWMVTLGCNKTGFWEERQYMVEPFEAHRVRLLFEPAAIPPIAPWVPVLVLAAASAAAGFANRRRKKGQPAARGNP